MKSQQNYTRQLFYIVLLIGYLEMLFVLSLGTKSHFSAFLEFAIQNRSLNILTTLRLNFWIEAIEGIIGEHMTKIYSFFSWTYRKFFDEDYLQKRHFYLAK